MPVRNCLAQDAIIILNKSLYYVESYLLRIMMLVKYFVGISILGLKCVLDSVIEIYIVFADKRKPMEVPFVWKSGT